MEKDGFVFDSFAESKFYEHLKIKQKNGDVLSFEMQKVFEIQPKYRHPKNNKMVRAIKYIPDFVIEYKNGDKEVVDVKGFQTDVFKMKMKMFMYKYGIPLVLVKYNKSKDSFVEI